MLEACSAGSLYYTTVRHYKANRADPFTRRSGKYLADATVCLRLGVKGQEKGGGVGNVELASHWGSHTVHPKRQRDVFLLLSGTEMLSFRLPSLLGIYPWHGVVFGAACGMLIKQSDPHL